MILRLVRVADWPAIEDLLRRYDLPLHGARDHVDGFVVAQTEGRVVGVAGLEIHGRAASSRIGDVRAGLNSKVSHASL